MKQRDDSGLGTMRISMRNRYLLIIGTVVLILAVLASQIQAVFVSLVFSLTLASAIAPVAEWMENKLKVPRVFTVVLVYVGTIVLYAVLAYFLYPTLKAQAVDLIKGFPEYSKGIASHYHDISSILHEKAGLDPISETEVKSVLKSVSSRALSFTSDAITFLASGLLISFLTAYFVIEAPSIWPRLLQWIPREHRQRVADTIRPLESRLGGYVRGQILVSLAVGTFIGIGLSILQVPHALILAVLAGLLNLVPFVGSLITAVLAIVVAFNVSLALAGATLLLYMLEQWVESNFIVPQLLGNQVELHPLVVLFAILIGASIMGLAGALIAVPIATATVFLAEEFYLKPLTEREREQDMEENSKPQDSNADEKNKEE